MPEWTPPLLDRTYTHYFLLYNAPVFSKPKPDIQAGPQRPLMLKNLCAWTWLTLEQICSGSY